MKSINSVYIRGKSELISWNNNEIRSQLSKWELIRGNNDEIPEPAVKMGVNQTE
ncbi:hypothetical protein LIT38_14315 [Bacillus sp. CMF12]|uniref:hypothetical protein n=1 Tax=Bacillus sp. CMF12 TaxID=2884834 RepID=UPI00207A1F3B|nr:hypothetical protein [Bacillus sp. CMF12]USK47785.1 hypothetical protein LIT38_14315 [Bacillus sp. CMF12]